MASNFFYMLDSTKRYCLSAKDSRGVEVLSSLENYLRDGTFSRRKYAKDFGLSFRLSDSELARRLQISESRVRNVKLELSSDLYGLFGKDYFNKLLMGDYEYCMHRLEVIRDGVGSSLTSYLPMFLSDVVSLPLYDKDKALRPSLCLDEIKFFKKWSQSAMEDEISRLDVEKLAYLVQLLSGSGTGLIEERLEFISLFDTLSV